MLPQAYTDAKKRLDDLDKQSWEIDQLREKATVKLHEEAVAYAFKARLFAGVEWAFEYDIAYREPRGSSTVCVLKGNTRRESAAVKELAALFETNYHCSSLITDTTTVRWDDGELRLVFKNFEALRAFCLEQGIKVNTHSLHAQLGSTKKELASYSEKQKKLEEFIAFVKEIAS